MTYTTVRFGLYEKISSKLLEGRDGTVQYYTIYRQLLFVADFRIDAILIYIFTYTRIVIFTPIPYG